MKLQAAISLALVILLCGCSHHQSASNDGGDKRALSDLNLPTLFLHMLSQPTFGQTNSPAQRIVTIRLKHSEEITVILGRDSSPTLSGRVDYQGGKFFAHLQGSFSTSHNFFDGELEPEKLVASQGGLASGGACSVFFLLSTNIDYRPALRHTQGL